jgi:hypothetical protein
MVGESLMEQHDLLYRQAYREYVKNNLEAARTIAQEAIGKAREFYFLEGRLIKRNCPACRAAILLAAIEWRSLLAQDE